MPVTGWHAVLSDLPSHVIRWPEILPYIIRHLCDLEDISTLEGTAGMHTLIPGQDITGIATFH